jgi:hypothetical protein
MEHLISIDEDSRIRVEENNYTLEYRVKVGLKPDGTKSDKEFRWIIGGHFPDLVSLSIDWINNVPARRKDGDLPIKNMKELVDCIQTAEKHITDLIKGE